MDHFPKVRGENNKSLKCTTYLDLPKGAKWFLKGVNSPEIGTPWKVQILMEISLGSFSSFASSTLEALAIRGVQSFSTQWNDPHRVSWSFLPGWLAYMRGWNTSHLQRDYFISQFFGIPINKPIFLWKVTGGFWSLRWRRLYSCNMFCFGESIPSRVFLAKPLLDLRAEKKTVLTKKKKQHANWDLHLPTRGVNAILRCMGSELKLPIASSQPTWDPQRLTGISERRDIWKTHAPCNVGDFPLVHVAISSPFM